MSKTDTPEKVSAAGEKTAVLLMHCPDRPGIIAILTEFINANGGNILYLDQYVDRVNSVFYMRVQWDLEGFAIPADKIRDYFDTLYAQRFGVTYNLYFTGTRSGWRYSCRRCRTASMIFLHDTEPASGRNGMLRYRL